MTEIEHIPKHTHRDRLGPMAELHITWLTSDGRGAGTGPAGVVRVAGTIPGDRVSFSETGRRGRTIDATLDEILEPSGDRQLPACPVWDSCGGCDLAQYAPESRLQALSAMVGHALRVDPPMVVPSPLAVHHRARVKLSVESGRLGYRAHR